MLYDPRFVPNYNVIRSHNPNTGVTGWDQANIRYCFMQNKYDMKENTYVKLDSRFNNNTLDVQRYIDDGGFIIHLTNFMGRFNGRQDKNKHFSFRFRSKEHMKMLYEIPEHSIEATNMNGLFS